MSESRSERFKMKYPVLHFALVQARYKRYNLGLLLAMFIPVIQYCLLLYFTDRDFSDGFYWVWYYRIYFRVVLFFLVSLVALIVGTGMFSDLISDDTIVYLFTKPIKRERIFFETFVAYLIIGITIVTPGIVTFHVVGDIMARMYDATFTITIFESLFNFGLEILGAYIVIFGLGAVFVTTGLGLKRPLLINLLIAFGIIVEAFLLDLIANDYEPVYIASNIVAKEVVGFSTVTEASTSIFRFSLGQGPGLEPFRTFINFLGIMLAALYIGYKVSQKKQLK